VVSMLLPLTSSAMWGAPLVIAGPASRTGRRILFYIGVLGCVGRAWIRSAAKAVVARSLGGAISRPANISGIPRPRHLAKPLVRFVDGVYAFVGDEDAAAHGAVRTEPVVLETQRLVRLQVRDEQAAGAERALRRRQLGFLAA
jgi:hypothetical protein